MGLERAVEFTRQEQMQRQCIWCQRPVPPSLHGGVRKKYCSKSCRSKADAARNGLRRSRHRLPRSDYQRWKWHNDPAWRDRRLAQMAARDALTRGAVDAEQFTLDEIYERDSGKCHLCHRRVKRSDASIDHIVPVSIGGSHVRANVALAHRSCNSAKNNRAMNEQLRLLG